MKVVPISAGPSFGMPMRPRLVSSKELSSSVRPEPQKQDSKTSVHAPTYDWIFHQVGSALW